MVIGILTAVGAATSVLTWAMDRSLEIEEQDNLEREMVIRQITGSAASMRGETKEIEIDDFVEVPADPAFGGRPVLLTHKEAVWWMKACKRPDDDIPEIRMILEEQEIRRMACSAR